MQVSPKTVNYGSKNLGFGDGRLFQKTYVSVSVSDTVTTLLARTQLIYCRQRKFSFSSSSTKKHWSSFVPKIDFSPNIDEKVAVTSFKTLLQQNPSFLNYWCQLTKLDLYNVHEMVVCNS